MDPFVVVAYPEPIALEAQTLDHDTVPEGNIALAYYFRGHLIARGIVTPDAVRAIHSLLESPVSVALAATEDDDGNIDGRICLILPVDADEAEIGAADAPPDEPWKASIPPPPSEIGSGYGATPESEEERPHVALLPIGNVVRNSGDRNHPEDVAGDAREMLANLLSGRGRDAVRKAIDDLLDSI